jgi:hypothetical protein
MPELENAGRDCIHGPSYTWSHVLSWRNNSADIRGMPNKSGVKFHRRKWRHHMANSIKANAAILSLLGRENISPADLVKRAHDGGDLQTFLTQHFGQFIEHGGISTLAQYLDLYDRVSSAIQAKRDQFPGFGDPTTSIVFGSEGRGWFQHFRNGSVFYAETFGAHEVHGAIREKYRDMGWQTSYLGYPTTDELSTNVAGEEVRYSNFEDGHINWTSGRGAFIDLSFYAPQERHQLGAWVRMSGEGFTPGGAVRFTVVGLTGAQGEQTTGVFCTAKPDGTFSNVYWDGRRWPRGGDAEMKALDQSTGRTATYPLIPALY